MSAPLLEAWGLRVDAGEGRTLFRELSLSLGRDRVALVGRNGVGKSTLLEILAGEGRAGRGSIVAAVDPVFVRQDPDPQEVAAATRRLHERARGDRAFAGALTRERRALGLRPLAELVGVPPSRGEARKVLLLAAKLAAPELLLLDEPTEDMDRRGVEWLCRWLRGFEGGLLVVSHHRGLLRCFEHFFVVAESGCRHVPRGFDALQRQLRAENAARERKYVLGLNDLDRKERHDEQVRRRRARKKNVGRLHELRRSTSRLRLNARRGYAQRSQAKAARIRDDRIEGARQWAKAMRRAMEVTLPLVLTRPILDEDDGRDLVTLEGVGVIAGGRPLLVGLDLELRRQRVAVTGPNGAGKTTLLGVIAGRREPTRGSVRVRAERIGSIAQGATDWMLDDSLLVHLLSIDEHASLETLAARVVAHRFPLGLARRPLRSLSPGERVRAALIALFARAPAVELLVLDEPTYCLDFVGVAALEQALQTWPGGLVVASHDDEFLAAIGIERRVELDGEGGHRVHVGAR